MINSLFHVERHNDIRKNAELPLEARLQIEFKESVGDQPDGVLVGTLFVQSDTDVEERILINAVVEVLSDALRKNLSSSVNELSLQRDVIKMNIDDIEAELKALYEEAKQFEQAKQMSMQMEALQRLEARRLDKEIETRVSDQRRELLRRRLDEAKKELSNRVAVRDKLVRELKKAQQALQDSKVRTTKKAEAEAEARRAHLEFELEAHEINKEVEALSQAEAEIRLQLSKLAETYQKTTMDMAVAEKERQQLEKLLARGRDFASELASNKTQRHQLDRRIQHLESQLASLRKSGSELQLKRDSLVPVQVRRWK